jgi:hypothetical protein
VGIKFGGAIGVIVLGSILANVYSKILGLPNEASLPAAVRRHRRGAAGGQGPDRRRARQLTDAVHEILKAA